jgi:hypothetical protein
VLVGIGAAFAAVFQYWPIEPGGSGRARGLLELLNLYIATFGNVGASLPVFSLFLVLAMGVWWRRSGLKRQHNFKSLHPEKSPAGQSNDLQASLDQLEQSGKTTLESVTPAEITTTLCQLGGSFGRKAVSSSGDGSGKEAPIHAKDSEDDEPIADREVASVLDRFGRGSPDSNAIAIRAAIRAHDGIIGILHHAITGIQEVQEQIVLQSARLLLCAWANQGFSFRQSDRINRQLEHFDSLLTRFDNTYPDWISAANQGYNEYHVAHISQQMESARKVAELVRWAAGAVPTNTTPSRRFYGFFDNIPSMDKYQWPDFQRDAIVRDIGKLSSGRHTGLNVADLLGAPLWHSQEAQGYDAHRLASRFAVAGGIGDKTWLPYSYCDWLSERRAGKTLFGGPYEKEMERYRRIVDLDHDWGDGIPAEAVSRSIGRLLTTSLDSKFWKRAYPTLQDETTE